MPKNSISTIVVAAVTLLLAGGCGGGGGGGNNGGGGGGGGGNTGDFAGSVNLQSGFLGEISFTVENGGATEGHLVVTTSANTPAFTDDGFPAGSYSIFGGVHDGVIDLQGSANGNFTITGQ